MSLSRRTDIAYTTRRDTIQEVGVLMKRFVKNEAVGLTVEAFRTMDRESFYTYNQQLTPEERRALNFINRAVSLQSVEHLSLALETDQPVVELDRIFLGLANTKTGKVLLENLFTSGVDPNQLVVIDGHRSLVRQPLAFPVGLYGVYDHDLFDLTVKNGLDLAYTTTLQRSDRFLETHEINTLDIVLLLTHTEELDERSLVAFDRPTTVGLVERLHRSNAKSLKYIVDQTNYDVSFQYAKHYPLFYAIVGRQTDLFEQMLQDALKQPHHEAMIKDALLAFHNYQPGLATSLGEVYQESLFEMGHQLKTHAKVDFNQLDDQYVLPEYRELVEQLRR